MGRAGALTAPGATADGTRAPPTSSTEPQAWHSGHRPTHRGDVAPHSAQR